MELDAHEPGVVSDLHDLHQPSVGGQARQAQPRRRQRLPEVVVELVAVAVALVDAGRAVGPGGEAVLRQLAGVAAQTHGAPLVGDPHLVGHQVDDRVLAVGGELPGLGPRQAADVAGELHHRHLHPQADAQEGHLVLPGVPDGGDLPLHPPAAEASGDQDPGTARQQLPGVGVGDGLAVHPPDVHLHVVLDPPVGQGLRHGEIGVVEGHIFAHQGDGHSPLGVLGPVDHGGPLGEVRHVADEPQAADHHVRQPLPLQHQGHLVEQIRRQVGDGVLHRDVAEQGDLLQDVPGDGLVAAAHDHVGLDAQAQQLLGGVLGGLALQLPGAGDGYDEGNVDEHDVVPPPLRRHLADGLQKGLGLDVPHGAADLHNGHVGAGGVQGVDPPLDLPGDVGDDLHRGPQIVPPALPVEHVPVHLAGGDGGVHVQALINEPLVVAQVQVRLRPVVGDEHLPVLVGAHGPRVHVEIGVQLLDLYMQAPLLQQPAQGGRRDPLSQARDHASRYKNVFDSHIVPSLSPAAGAGTPCFEALSPPGEIKLHALRAHLENGQRFAAHEVSRMWAVSGPRAEISSHAVRDGTWHFYYAFA